MKKKRALKHAAVQGMSSVLWTIIVLTRTSCTRQRSRAIFVITERKSTKVSALPRGKKDWEITKKPSTTRYTKEIQSFPKKYGT